MKTLPLDISRCSARYDFDPDGEWCPERDTCQRYLAFLKWDREAGVPDYKGISVTMGRPGCTLKIEANNND